jgi:hypothetical protein
MAEGMDYIVAANGKKAVLRWWDEHVPIGARIRCGESWFTTWSHAGYGRGWRPCVFVEEVQEPVLLSRVSEIVVGELRYVR